MENFSEQLIDMLNQALRLEYASQIQYLTHAKMVSGINSEAVAARLEEIAGDEREHAEKFRMLISDYLGGTPIMEMDKTYAEKELNPILEINLRQEKEAVDFYKKIYRFVCDNKEKLPYCFERVEHELRHIIMDEEEHAVEISALLGL